jgi:hypothetical protein
MSKDPKNRFNEKKPFDVIRAEDFGEDLYEFYEPLEKLMRETSGIDITGSRTVFLIGGRGTGKTMVLKFLSWEMQLKDYLKKRPSDKSKDVINNFFNNKKFLGIYLHFRTIEYDSIRGDFVKLFKSYLSIKMAEQLFNLLIYLKNKKIINRKQENKLSKYFLEQIVEPKIEIKTNFNYCLEVIRNNILPLFEKIFEKSSYCSSEEIKKLIGFPTILSNNIFFKFNNLVFSEIDNLKGKNLFILLDELEYLNPEQTRFIGQLIKDSDGTSVIFKIGSRFMPKTLYVGDSNELLQEIHDYRKISITDSLNAAFSGKKNDYNDLIKNILNKRLANSKYFSKKGIKDINQLFPNSTFEEEAIKLINKRNKHWLKFITYLKECDYDLKKINEIIEKLKYSPNPIIEKLNMLLYYRGYKPNEINKMFKNYLNKKDKKYSDLYQKNSLNLLFQLYSDYRMEKKYSGIDVFVHLSSGIIRNAIELCNNALNTAYNYNYEPSINHPVDIFYQDLGAKKMADTQYNDIQGINENIGLKVREFINEIGTIFRDLQLNRDIVEPEPTHFETNYAEITGEAKEIFDAALNYSFLQIKRPMDPKTISETKKDDILINRILAPRFKISYRLRGRTYISPYQINDLIVGNDKIKKRVKREIYIANTKNDKISYGTQKTLFHGEFY